ncbi:MAG: glycosyltransferase family 25 protein [Gemmatimonadales bacterium]|nr:glycosyltransferase family 25 protein [Gemmatimonadales bacterium]
MASQIERVRALHQRDCESGAGWGELLGALTRKYPRAGRSLLKSRRFLPRQLCHTFGRSIESGRNRIEQIYVINLASQPHRWAETVLELGRVLDSSRVPLTERALRYPAIDARILTHAPIADREVDPFYTLRDQLFVEPQPRALPNDLELDRPIRMSHPEVAVARSHIGVWRRIASGKHRYALVLEDDVWIRRGFGRHLDQAWGEMMGSASLAYSFDILYLSYKEVKDGAHKTFLSDSVFRPIGIAAADARSVAMGPDRRRSKPFMVLVSRAGFQAAHAHLQALFPGLAPEQMLVGLEFAGHHGMSRLRTLWQPPLQPRYTRGITRKDL